jgi:hypothetical protein
MPGCETSCLDLNPSRTLGSYTSLRKKAEPDLTRRTSRSFAKETRRVKRAKPVEICGALSFWVCISIEAAGKIQEDKRDEVEREGKSSGQCEENEDRKPKG